MDQSNDGAQNSDDGRESCRHLEDLRIGFSLSPTQTELVGEQRFNLAALVHIHRKQQRLPKKPVARLLKHRLDSQQPSDSRQPHVGYDFFHKIFAARARGQKQIAVVPQRVKQRDQPRGDKGDAQRSTDHAQDAGCLKKVVRATPVETMPAIIATRVMTCRRASKGPAAGRGCAKLVMAWEVLAERLGMSTPAISLKSNSQGRLKRMPTLSTGPMPVYSNSKAIPLRRDTWRVVRARHRKCMSCLIVRFPPLLSS